ncbi:phage portal protein [Microbacterium sp. GXF6406]
MESSNALRLVNRIYDRLAARRPDITRLESYYAGDQPLAFATDEWQKANSARYKGFSDNWCRPVVDAEAERLGIKGIRTDDRDAGRTLWGEWERNEMELQSSQGFVTSLAATRSFVLVWGDSDDKPVISWEHPSSVEIEYDWENPRLRSAALKTWQDQAWEYATLYTPDEVWKFRRKRQTSRLDRESQAKQARQDATSTGGWEPREVGNEPWPLRNPLGVVPIVEIPNRPILAGDPISEIAGVAAMQDAINLLWAYLLLAADYASMPARVVMHQAPPKVPVLDKDGQPIPGKERVLKIEDLAEKRLLFLQGKDTSIDSWQAAALEPFTKTIEFAVGHISAQTRTPPTYLLSTVGMSNVSGDGLKASEIGLVKKTKEFASFVSPAIREIFRLIALVKNESVLIKNADALMLSWVDPEIRSESQLADALMKKKAIGYPLEYLLELDGLSGIEIDRVLAMAEDERRRQLPWAVPQKGEPDVVEAEIVDDNPPGIEA